MSEVSSALGIESVQWLAQGAESLTVQVGGRWRRRRPIFSGAPLLVIEAGSIRHRFPAMPEPPGLSGAAPGTWQLSFSVPAAVAKRPGARAWLQLGSMVVPLPVPVDAAEPAAADDETLAQRRVRAAELAAESAARRAAQAQSEAQQLSDRIAELERGLREQTELAAASERAGRAAEQRAHAEEALRRELEEELAAAHTPRESTAGYELRIQELEAEAGRLRRALDEAEHVAQAAAAARQRAEAALAELSSRGAERAGRLRSELELAVRTRPASPLRPRPALAPSDGERLEREAQVVAARRSRDLVVLERQMAQRAARADHAYRAIQELRQELSALRGSATAPAPSETIAEAPPPATPSVPATIDAERLAQALARLREQAPGVAVPTPAGSGPTRAAPWLRRALRNLARRDPAGATRVLAALLRAQPTEAEDAVRWLACGPLRRGVKHGVARARGRRGRYAALGRLLRTPMGLSEIEVEPLLAFTLVSAMLEAAWTAGERFTIAYEATAYLHIRDGSPVSVTETPPAGPVATTLVCPPTAVLRLLGGPAPAQDNIRGEARPLELVRAWLERAQSG